MSEPIQARPVGVLERAWRWWLHNPAVASLTAAVALARCGGIAGMTWKWFEAVEEQGHARAEADAKEAAQSRTLNSIISVVKRLSRSS